jgi:hypothetical protein
MPPHQLPPPLLAGAFACSPAAFLSASWGSELVALGVKLAWYDRELSADFLAALAGLSSEGLSALGGGGVFVDFLFAGDPLAADSLMRGV